MCVVPYIYWQLGKGSHLFLFSKSSAYSICKNYCSLRIIQKVIHNFVFVALSFLHKDLFVYIFVKCRAVILRVGSKFLQLADRVGF